MVSDLSEMSEWDGTQAPPSHSAKRYRVSSVTGYPQCEGARHAATVYSVIDTWNLHHMIWRASGRVQAERIAKGLNAGKRMRIGTRGTFIGWYAPKVGVRHGTLSRYTNYRCRCEKCRAVKRAYDAAYKAGKTRP